MIVDKHELYRMSQYCVLVYKFSRLVGIDSYQLSVLFTMYNCDSLGAGMNCREISTNNAMSATVVKANLVKLLAFDHVKEMPFGTKGRVKYCVSESGLAIIHKYTKLWEEYKGESVDTYNLSQSEHFEKRKRIKKERLERLASSPYHLKQLAAQLDKIGNGVKLYIPEQE